jgi:hypothetical protein
VKDTLKDPVKLRDPRHSSLSVPCGVLLLVLAGCHGASPAGPAADQASQRARIESERQQLDLIPPPAKSRYTTIRSFDSWLNPYLTVQASMLELHITLADANPSTLGAGGMLRPIGARRQEVNISLDSLGDAVTAIPQTAWPYGRVVALEEAHNTPPAAEPAVRRAMETTIARLNDLGIVVYDIDEGKIQ